MASNIQPTGLDWKNLPQKTTPISAENLNKMANTIDDLVEAVNPLNTVEANPVGTPTEGLEKVEIDGTLYEVKGGHKILNDSGTTLTQKDNLQFKGVYTQNNGDNTEVDICRTMTKAQMEALSGEALKGFINTSDEPDSLPLTAEWVAYGNGSVKDGLDNKVSKTGDTMTGNLTIEKENTSTSLTDSELILGNNKASGTTGNSEGVLSLFSDGVYRVVLLVGNTLTANRFINFPNKTGTIALTSDIEKANTVTIRKPQVVTPSNSGKSSLLDYINDVLVPENYSIYSFPTQGFNDLPSNDWGYTLTVHFEAGATYVECYKHLSNVEIWYRAFSATAQWAGNWVKATLT